MAYPMGESKRDGLRVDLDRRLKLEFHGSKITSDGGLLAYRELDDALGLTEVAGTIFQDSRTGKNGWHGMTGQFRQSVFARLGGYEDVNDADRLGRDPAMRWIVGGKAVERQAASTSQMGRFETELLATDANIEVLAGMNGAWIDKVHDRRPPKMIILDMDTRVMEAVMSNFRPVDRETGFLLPPSVEEWLPERHLARFVVEVIEQWDLSAFVKAYRGSGSASYHPSMLLGLLVYGYATGVFSSRKLERATYDSVAFRFIAANDHPDHDTIAAFRRRFLDRIEGLFVEVLLLDAHLAQDTDADQVGGEDLRTEPGQLIGALIGQHHADQERDQPDDGQGVEARLLHMTDQRGAADARGLDREPQHDHHREAQVIDQADRLS